jgi:hypothetical protein
VREVGKAQDGKAEGHADRAQCDDRAAEKPVEDCLPDHAADPLNLPR